MLDLPAPVPKERSTEKLAGRSQAVTNGSPMLQGSLEKFALDEVLGLLSSTSKTGHLEIAGDRGHGSLLFSDGKLVDAKASNAGNGKDLEDVMFELLRFKDGTFNFDSREVEVAEDASSVDAVLVAAESRLRDWQQIEAVVPSMAHMVTPVAQLPSEEVTISRTEWSAITTIAAGCPVSVVCDQLDLGEVEGSRLVKDLAERRLISVDEPAVGRPGVAGGSSIATPTAAPVSASDLYPAPVQPLAEDERPPIPPPPGGLDPLGTDDEALDSFIPPPPPAPPSPAEINEFDVNDASELLDGEEAEEGGLLMQYLSGDD